MRGGKLHRIRTYSRFPAILRIARAGQTPQELNILTISGDSPTQACMASAAASAERSCGHKLRAPHHMYCRLCCSCRRQQQLPYSTQGCGQARAAAKAVSENFQTHRRFDAEAQVERADGWVRYNQRPNTTTAEPALLPPPSS